MLSAGGAVGLRFLARYDPVPAGGHNSRPTARLRHPGRSVSRIAANPSWEPPGPDTAYFIFTGRNVMSCADEGKTVCFLAQYCGYHGSFVSGAATILYANMPDAGTNLSVQRRAWSQW